MHFKEYLPFPVTSEWRGEVRAWLDSKPRGEQERLREFIVSRGLKCSSGELADLLSGKAQTSPLVEPIHEYLHWPVPLPPIASRDVGEVAHQYLRIDQEQRDLIAVAVAALQGKSGDQAKVIVGEMLKMVSAQKKG